MDGYRDPYHTFPSQTVDWNWTPTHSYRTCVGYIVQTSYWLGRTKAHKVLNSAAKRKQNELDHRYTQNKTRRAEAEPSRQDYKRWSRHISKPGLFVPTNIYSKEVKKHIRKWKYITCLLMYPNNFTQHNLVNSLLNSFKIIINQLCKPNLLIHQTFIKRHNI